MASSIETGMEPFFERYVLRQRQPQRRVPRSTDSTVRFASLTADDEFSSQNKKTYKYAPLPGPDYIRLLYLKPAAANASELHGFLRWHKLNQHSVYEAISYAWGDFHHLCHAIHLNGKTLKITDNLFAALMAYSLPHRVRVLWVDAICINQADALEKAQQVTLMADIFNKASMVQVWLSLGSRWAMDAMGFLKRLSSRAETLGVSADVGHPRTIDEYPVLNISRRDAEKLIDDAIDHHVDFVLNHCSWFNRVWVVQEVALATDLVVSCGHTKIPWVDMARALEALYGAYRQILLGRARDKMEGLKAAWSLAQHRDEFRYIDRHLDRSHHWATNLAAKQMRSRKCTDDRDRVYAMLAMTRSHWEMEPDYTKTVAETYTEFTKKFSPNSQLYSAGLARRQPGRIPHATAIHEDNQTRTLDITNRDYLPSWAPEYRPPGNHVWAPSFGGQYRTASRTPFFFLNHPTIPKIMHATGAILDTIATTSCTFPAMRPPDYFFSPSFFFPLTTLLNHHLANPPSSHNTPSTSGLPFAINLAKTLTAGIADCPGAETFLFSCHGIEKFLPHLERGTLPWLTAIWTAFATHALSPTGELYQAILLRTISPPTSLLYSTPLDYTMLSPNAQIATGFLNYLHNVLRPEKLFTTCGGRIGLAPRMARPGDGVVVVNGCHVPYVVRGVGKVRCEGEEQEGAVVVVGPCYVQGWMRGEIVDGMASGMEKVAWTRYPGDAADSLHGWLTFV